MTKIFTIFKTKSITDRSVSGEKYLWCKYFNQLIEKAKLSSFSVKSLPTIVHARLKNLESTKKKTAINNLREETERKICCWIETSTKKRQFVTQCIHVRWYEAHDPWKIAFLSTLKHSIKIWTWTMTQEMTNAHSIIVSYCLCD